MSTKVGSQQEQSPEDNTGGRTSTSASRYNQIGTDPTSIYTYIDIYVDRWIDIDMDIYLSDGARDNRPAVVVEQKWISSIYRYIDR